MLKHSLFIFGEAERGELGVPYICNSLRQLAGLLGNPPKGSRGIELAIEALLYNRTLIYFRVQEEGFSKEEYLRGFHVLKHNQILGNLSAICMPGVGDRELIEEVLPLCNLHKGLLIIDERDLFDYLTEKELASF